MKKQLLLLLILISSVGFTQTIHTIEVGSDGFTPSSLTVEIGDQIDFILNLGTASGSHSSTSSTIPVSEASWNYLMTCGTCLYTVFANVEGVYNFTDSNSGMSGSFTVNGTSGVEENTTAKSGISQNYPNPFTGSTFVEYDINSELGTINITDITGKIVATHTLPNNTGVIEIGNGLSSGTYFYSLLVNGELIETNKMIIK